MNSLVVKLRNVPIVKAQKKTSCVYCGKSGATLYVEQGRYGPYCNKKCAIANLGPDYEPFL